ncbi:MAG TPA: penicillin-binding transpeptidase domain-containing protein [Pseudonocardia sp.]
MRRAPRRLVGLLLAAVVGAGASGCGLFSSNGPDATVNAFLTAWSAGDIAAASAATDDPGAAAQLLTATRTALAPVSLTATLAQLRQGTDRASASIDVTWDLGQNRRWHYLDDLDLRPKGDAPHGWLVQWAPTVVHPQLGARQLLALRTVDAQPAPVVDRAGAALLSSTPVVTVLLDKGSAGLPAVTGALAAALGPVDPEITAASIANGVAKTADGQSYTVAVLRQSDYQRVKAAIHELPGVRFTSDQRLLAPDAGFASQVLPAVRRTAAPQLDGVPGWSVLAVDGTGSPITTLVETRPQPGTTVATGLDLAIQTAAEDAVEPVPQQTVLVAVAPSTGDILAVAQNGPADAAGAIALTGRYPPGSTFKMITATAAVADLKLTGDTPEACPGVTVIGGRPVPNEGNFDLGTVPLRTAFAKSCNTTFAQLGAALPPDALPAAALRLGIGADYGLPGLTTVTGSVPAATDLVQRAEDGFGQGQVIATPLGMALAAATVARGATVVPQLIHGRATQVITPATPPDPAALDQLRPMMRAVVTEGTARLLGRRGEVYGKTGTAEYTDDGRAHGWFVGYRGDLAFAVLIVDGGSSTPAVAVADRFLAALG